MFNLDVLEDTFNPSACEAETEDHWVQGQLEVHSEKQASQKMSDNWAQNQQ